MHLSQHTLIWFGCLIVAVILHEISHGLVALWFGDRTAREAGRLTLNPVPHIDPVGSIVLPALMILSTGTAVGWAKPVPVNPGRLRRPRRDMILVSLAGPATNLLLMAGAAIGARYLFLHTTSTARSFEDLPLGIQVLFTFAEVNVLLAVFNLLPLPPLDGSALVERLLPAAWLPRWYQIRPYGILVIFVLVLFTSVFTTLLTPVDDRLFNFVFR